MWLLHGFSLIALGAEFGEMQSGIQPSSVGGAAEDELSEEVSRFVDQVIKNALIGYERELAEQGKSRVSVSQARLARPSHLTARGAQGKGRSSGSNM